MTKRTKSSLRAAVVTLVAGCVLPAGAQSQSATRTATEPATPPPPPTPTQTQSPVSPEEPEPSTTARVLDALILRPLGLLVLPVGVAAFIPAALLTAPDGMDSVQTAFELFVTTPANYVFQRKLGDI